MRILYLDTSSSFLYCGLFDDVKSIFTIKEFLGKKMSEEVLFKINQKFEEKKISTDSVEKIILVNGPGSFTGVRIGITIAKVYSLFMKIPIITISSLNAMSLSVKSELLHVPLIDARRGYVYAGVYNSDSTILLKDQYILLDDLKNYLQSLGKKYIFISNDFSEFDCLKYVPDICYIVEKSKNLSSTETHLVNANYLKSTEAEEKINDNRN